MSKPEGSTYLKGLDGMRGISILLVLFSHLGSQQWLPEGDIFRLRAWQLFSGTAGVVVFFTISGFLITRLLLIEKERTGTIHLVNFFFRRLLRLLPPLVAFYLLVGTLMAAHLIQREPVGLLFSALYLYNFVPSFYYSAELGHTWSLAVEEQFYLSWPLVIKWGHGQAWYFTIVAGIGLCLLATPILPGLLGQVNFQYHGQQYNALVTFFYGRWFLPAAAPILLGCLVSLVLSRDAYWLGHPRTLAIACILYLSPVWLPRNLLIFATIVQATGTGLLLAWLCLNQASRLIKGLETGALKYVGQISYGLYVYQGLFLRTGPGGTLPFQCWPYNILLTFLFAFLSFEILEKPIMRRKASYR